MAPASWGTQTQCSLQICKRQWRRTPVHQLQPVLLFPPLAAVCLLLLATPQPGPLAGQYQPSTTTQSSTPPASCKHRLCLLRNNAEHCRLAIPQVRLLQIAMLPATAATHPWRRRTAQCPAPARRRPSLATMSSASSPPLQQWRSLFAAPRLHQRQPEVYRASPARATRRRTRARTCAAAAAATPAAAAPLISST